MNDNIARSIDEAGASFKRGTTEMLLLAMLTEREWYVYELDKRLKEITNGTFDTKTPHIYTVLYRMEKKEFVTTRVELEKRRSRVFYQITPLGREYLRQLLALYRDISAGIQTALTQTIG